MFTVEFYETSNGDNPVVDFLDSLDPKMNAKIVSLLEILEEKGNELREPYSAYLRDGLFELRVKQGNNITRILYFFFIEKRIVVTNGFIKKTQKTPVKEIELAIKRKTDWIKRYNVSNDK